MGGRGRKRFPAKFQAFCWEPPVRFRLVFGGFAANMPKQKKSSRTTEKVLDADSGKKLRGRKGVRRSEIVGRADNYRAMFWTTRLDRKKKEWVRDKPREWAVRLLAAKTEDEISGALDSAPLSTQNELKPLVPLILDVKQERKFPKRQGFRLDFLADSLAGYGRIRPRRSRDICEQERKKKVHRIIREESYIVCSCGYKGPSFHGRCPKCRPNEIFIPFLRLH
jgi:hypothetical protein